jgi:hypothetical protein
MKRFCFIFILLILGFAVTAASAQEDETGPIAVECDDGTEFTNGVAVTIIQMRTGFNYTATVLGIDGFDPALAIFSSEGGSLCADESREARSYAADLPTTGEIEPQDENVQITFNNGASSGDAFADITLVIGSAEDETGEFLLLLEGMAVTEADGSGDPFSVFLNEPVIASEIPVTMYAISVTDALDPLINLVDEDGDVIEDEEGNDIYCDDAGSEALCWGESESLDSSFVSRTGDRTLGGYELDSMLSLPVEGIEPGLYFNYLVTSYNNTTTGDYVVAFHIGIGAAEEATGGA